MSKLIPPQRGCIWALVICVCLIALLAGLFQITHMRPRWALPASARHVKDHYEDSPNGDFIRCIRAHLPEKDFETYAKRLGMTTRFDPVRDAAIESKLNITGGPSWFRRPEIQAGDYYEYGGSASVKVLIHRNGEVYYMCLVW